MTAPDAYGGVFAGGRQVGTSFLKALRINSAKSILVSTSTPTPTPTPTPTSTAAHRMASMKRPTSTPPHLLSDNASRIAHLKKVKHDLTGHVSRKADALNNGLIPLLAELLHNSQHHDQVYIHASQILAVLAHGRSLVAATSSHTNGLRYQRVYHSSNHFSTPIFCSS